MLINKKKLLWVLKSYETEFSKMDPNGLERNIEEKKATSCREVEVIRHKV